MDDQIERTAHGRFTGEFVVRGDIDVVRPAYEEFRSALAQEGVNAHEAGVEEALAYFEPNFYGPGQSSIEASIEAYGASMSDVEKKARDLIARVVKKLGITLVGDDGTGRDNSRDYEEFASYLISA